MEESLNKIEHRLDSLEKNTSSLAVYFQDNAKAVSHMLSGITDTLGIMNKQLKKVEAELAALNTKINQLDGTTTNQFDVVGGKLDELKEDIRKINDVTGFQDIFSNLKVVSK